MYVALCRIHQTVRDISQTTRRTLRYHPTGEEYLLNSVWLVYERRKNQIVFTKKRMFPRISLDQQLFKCLTSLAKRHLRPKKAGSSPEMVWEIVMGLMGVISFKCRSDQSVFNALFARIEVGVNYCSKHLNSWPKLPFPKAEEDVAITRCVGIHIWPPKLPMLIWSPFPENTLLK